MTPFWLFRPSFLPKNTISIRCELGCPPITTPPCFLLPFSPSFPPPPSYTLSLCWSLFSSRARNLLPPNLTKHVPHLPATSASVPMVTVTRLPSNRHILSPKKKKKKKLGEGGNRIVGNRRISGVWKWSRMAPWEQHTAMHQTDFIIDQLNLKSKMWKYVYCVRMGAQMCVDTHSITITLINPIDPNSCCYNDMGAQK